MVVLRRRWRRRRHARWLGRRSIGTGERSLGQPASAAEDVGLDDRCDDREDRHGQSQLHEPDLPRRRRSPGASGSRHLSDRCYPPESYSPGSLGRRPDADWGRPQSLRARDRGCYAIGRHNRRPVGSSAQAPSSSQVRTPPFQGGSTGSNPVGATNVGNSASSLVNMPFPFPIAHTLMSDVRTRSHTALACNDLSERPTFLCQAKTISEVWGGR